MENQEEMQGRQVTNLRDASLSVKTNFWHIKCSTKRINYRELLNTGFPPESINVDNVGKEEIYFLLAAHMGTARTHLNFNNIGKAEKVGHAITRQLIRLWFYPVK